MSEDAVKKFKGTKSKKNVQQPSSDSSLNSSKSEPETAPKKEGERDMKKNMKGGKNMFKADKKGEVQREVSDSSESEDSNSDVTSTSRKTFGNKGKKLGKDNKKGGGQVSKSIHVFKAAPKGEGEKGKLKQDKPAHENSNLNKEKYKRWDKNRSSDSSTDNDKHTQYTKNLENNSGTLKKEDKVIGKKMKEAGSESDSDERASLARVIAVSYTHLTLPTTPYV
eukprot:TRINITY_DN19112_c0_g1_i1.p2 TRINITY_DN19112_c0_g1~~TRINITY_DN19112_c0_g1_i1.p2  ORF type:complete len:223 (-),score=56.16 TRINITY_DN19112_c0_g1_i1:35-703(-)